MKEIMMHFNFENEIYDEPLESDERRKSFKESNIS